MSNHGFAADEQEIRAAENEALFREVKERISELDETSFLELHPFVCECANPGCVDVIPMSTAEYRKTRADPTYFVVNPDHVGDGIGRVVLGTQHYVIVKKTAE